MYKPNSIDEERKLYVLLRNMEKQGNTSSLDYIYIKSRYLRLISKQRYGLYDNNPAS